jgi:Protein of unknown function (DUF3500)
MHDLAVAFLRSLNPDQRAVALFPFRDAERFRWRYTPGQRGGLTLRDMTSPQRDHAMALLDSGLSDSGAGTARAIIGHEVILRRMEAQAGDPRSSRRDPELYYFSVFGEPSAIHPWGWRVGGHHLCLHFTVSGGAIATTPLFFGANPARVPRGPNAGRRLLAPEEDLARELLAALDAGQRRRAIVSSTAPDDILTGNSARAEIARVPSGIEYSELAPDQQRRFAALVGRYVGRVRDPVDVELEQLYFAWAGSVEVSHPHYYAVKGTTFLVEYDNTQNLANHIHTVWRDAAADWGADVLAAHYSSEHS